MRLHEHADLRVLHLDPDGPVIAAPSDGSQLVGDVLGHGADMVVVPVSRLDPEFFRLRSGLAGEILQKLVNYRIRVAVLGDITDHLQESDALRAFVGESNRGTQAWFVPDEAALAERLGPAVEAS
ncbi:DUF4180 domain-containing protein [Mumia sp. DW29H23]|uniref:DUF4180 domain-containing protein n=1 Tax=Mumia sp. DW29H23 TaxID=3421241 RepID=UPI003D69CCCE